MYIYNQELSDLLDKLELMKSYTFTMRWLLSENLSNKQFRVSYKNSKKLLSTLTCEVRNAIEKNDARKAA